MDVQTSRQMKGGNKSGSQGDTYEERARKGEAETVPLSLWGESLLPTSQTLQSRTLCAILTSPVSGNKYMLFQISKVIIINYTAKEI